jgi:hypothetical protein
MSRDEKCGFLSPCVMLGSLIFCDYPSCWARLLQRRTELSELIREPKASPGSLAKVTAVLDCAAIKLAGCSDHLHAEFHSNLMSQCQEIIRDLGEFAFPTAASGFPSLQVQGRWRVRFRSRLSSAFITTFPTFVSF